MTPAERTMALTVLIRRIEASLERGTDHPTVRDNWDVVPHLKTLGELA